jgi:hypothetical protein
MSISHSKRSRKQVFLLGGVCMLLLVATVWVSGLIDAGGSAAPEVDLPQAQASDQGSLDPLASADAEFSTREGISNGGDEREVLGAPATLMVGFTGRAEDRISLEGIEGAAVKVRVGEDIVLGVTGAGGAFSLMVPEGSRLDVEASAEGYLPARRAGVRAQTEAVLRLDRSSSLSGLVVGPGGEDMEKAEVHVIADDRREERALEPELDERGAFEVPNIEPGEFNVAVWVPGWSYAVERDVIVRPGQRTSLVFELDRAGSASARVVQEGTTTGIEGVEVRVDPWIQGLTRDVEEIVTLSYRTDEGGRIEMDSLNPGENRVRLYAPWGAMKDAPRLLVGSAEHQHLIWTLKAPASCAGLLLDSSGDPTAGTVTVVPTPERWGSSVGNVSGEWKTREEWPRECAVGADGRFRFDMLPSSMNLRFHGSSNEDPTQFGTLDRRLKPGGEVADMELRMTGMVTIEGRVMDRDERPVADATISTWRLPRATDAPILTDEEGHFSFTCLLEKERSRRGGFTVRHEVYQSHFENIGSRAPDGPFEIHLRPANEVSGRVVNENGDAVPWARVSARTEGDRRRNESTHADEFGRFRFGTLREGTWEIYPWASGYERREMLKVEVPFDGELTLHMERVHVPDPATVRGHAILPDGTAPSRLRIERLRSAAMAVDGGEFRIYGLSPGDHYLVLEASGCAPRSLGKIVLREAEERDVGLVRMFPGVSVNVFVNAEGDVPGESGPSISDARVRLYPVSGFAVEAGRGTRRPYRVRRGAYPMGTLEQGVWRVEVRRDGYKRWESEVFLGAGDKQAGLSGALDTVRVILERRE